MKFRLRKYHAILTLFVFLLSLGLACTPEPTGNNGNNNGNNNGTPALKLALDWQFSPKVPVPNRPAQLLLSIKEEGGKAITPSKIGLVASLDSEKVEISLSKGEKGYTASNIILKKSGEWELTATIEVAGKSQSVKYKLSISCDGGGTAGASCCEDKQCGNGLSCVYGACKKELNAGDSSCYEGNDCQSKVCEKNICLAGSCSDGSKNGRETDVDCGGACGPCAAKKACSTNKDCQSGLCNEKVCGPPPGSLIGTGDGSTQSVTWKVISKQGMSDPTSLAFHPNKPNELWITNRITDSFTVVFGTGTPDQTQGTYYDRSQHFMEEVMSMAFDGKGYVGTCMDSTNTYGGLRTANFFMGPATWSDDVNKLIRAGRSIHVTHLDMLHSTPRCMGIAAAGKHTFFAFNGMLGTIDWYDFREPHCPGCDDHSDGIKRRYYSPKLNYVKSVPSHMVYDKENKHLYIADTGSGQIKRLDHSKANQSRRLTSRSDYVFPRDGALYAMTGDTTEVLVKFPGPLRSPSGLAIHNKTMYVSDNKTGKLYAFDLDGKLLRTLDSGLGSGALAGIAVNPSDNKLYLVDRKSNRVLRIDP